MVRGKYSDPEDSFAARTIRDGECLIWTGSLTPKGYGTICIGYDRKPAHVYAWERENGPVPDGAMVDHKFHCDHACVEVEHLRLSTPSQNNANRSGATTANRSTGARNVTRNGSGYGVQVKKRWFGTYPTLDEAKAVAEKARKEMFGEFAGRG